MLLVTFVSVCDDSGACEFVTCEVPDFENATRMIGSRVVLSDKKISSPYVTHDVARAFILILLLALERSTFVFPFLNLINNSDYVADQETLRRSAKWRVWSCG